jgi:glycosyltransferase involved in cell wall biosynthesis
MPTIIRNVVDLRQFVFRKRMPLRPLLICTRGFHPYYRPDLVVHAFAVVRQSFPDARLNLVGSGQMEPEIRALVAGLKLSGVNFAGAIVHREIARSYDAADIFINASNLDNMPVSILEAFAAGTPVVTTAPEGMCHLVEHERTGLLSAPGDSHALAENVTRLLKDPDLASRLAHNAREEAARYSWEKVRQDWLNLYRSVLQGAGGIAIENTIA